jgi:hypothetical protein
LAVFAATAVQAAPPELSVAAAQQIEQLKAEKSARTPAQKKLDSNLLLAIRTAAGNTAMYGNVQLQATVVPDASGKVKVDIRVPVDAASLALVTGLGGQVLGSFPIANSIQALVPIDKVEQLASDPRVRSIRPPSRPSTNRAVKAVGDATASAAPQQPLSPRLQRFQATVKRALAAHQAETQNCCGAGVILNSGSVNSQGDVAHRANNARAAFSVNGAGIRIGVLSDSFDNLGGATADILSGDLPGPGNPNGFLTPVAFAGSGDCAAPCGADEGRAMLQIVHDLAPGAILYFATAFNSDTDFANNIRALGGIAPAAPPFGNIAPKCDIIIDDVSYSNESGLHDGQPAPSDANLALITQAVNDVTAAGVLYFSSAANSGNKVFGTSGAWEGDFTPGVTPPLLAGAGPLLIWNGASAVLNPLTAATNDVVIQWSDPIGGSCNDYDLYILNPAGTAITNASTNTQDCTPGNDPYEEAYSGGPNYLVGSNLVVALFSGSPRFISMTSQRGQTLYNTNGATRGHNAAASGFSVAATPAALEFEPPTVTGPYPGAFNAGNQIEAFSSDGPRRAFWNAAGVAYTPGNLLATGGTLHQKPDFTAADGVDTTLPPATGLNPFYGTSAAAPHAGAIAALVKSAAPAATNAQITTYLTSTALNIMTPAFFPPGFNEAAGVGILQAFQAVSAAKGGVGLPVFDATNVTVTRVPSAGPILPGDSASMLVQITNNGASTGTGITAVLTTSTPCITITNGTSSYPNTAVGASSTNATPFAFSLSGACICPVTIDFTLTVSFAGGSSVITFSYVTGPPPVVINADFNSTPVVPVGYGYSSGTQDIRLSRTASGGTCSAVKPFPGSLGAGTTRRYNAYTFTTGSVSPNYCINVTLDHPSFGAVQIQSGAYLGAFNPLNLATNYKSDSGASFSTVNYAFTVPASTAVTITVNEVFAQTGSDPYTLTIGGLCGVVGGTPNVTKVSSRMVHGAAGPFDLTLSGGPASPTVEPRAGTCHMVVFTFDKPVVSGNANVSEGTATVGPITFSGNEMRVQLTGVTDIQYVTVNVNTVVAADTGTGGTGSVRMGLLAGNVMQTGVGSLADLVSIAPNITQPVTASTFLTDVFVDGAINVADLVIAGANQTNSLP